MITPRTVTLAFTLIACAACAEQVGVSLPAPSLTVARVQMLPANERGPWLAYLRRSDQQRLADKAALAKERIGLAQIPPLPEQGNSARSIPLDRDAAYYRSPEARRLGDNIVSFQIASGGWSKNLAMKEPRLRGQSYTAANLPPTPVPDDDFDKARDESWHYVGTLDNDATNTELHFLAKLVAANPGPASDPYRRSIERGIRYLLAAQYPNGGWPQVWPLEGGYHDAITYNDDAVTESAVVLSDVAAGHSPSEGAPEDYSFLPAQLRRQADAAASRALTCILRTQVRLPNGTLTVWAQQHDPLTLQPVSGRNFEPAALSAGESATIVDFLMSIPAPSPAVIASVDAAVCWFQATRITGYDWRGGRSTPGGRKLVPDPAGVLWPRYISLTTGKPIFGDRDKTLHSDVMEISLERRNGYGWYGNGPAHVLAAYPAWKAQHSKETP